MALADFFSKLPMPFVLECLESLPGNDRKRLLHVYNCRVKMGPGALSRKARVKAEAKKLFAALERADDVEDKRSLFQGWLALRAPMIIALLDAWEVEHDNGIVEDFDWVSKLSDEAIESSIKTVREAHPEEATDIAFMVYFAYLEMPEFEKWFKPEDVFKAHFEAAGAGAKGD